MKDTSHDQPSPDTEGFNRAGFDLPLFSPGEGGPQITSARDMNRVVSRANALSNVEIRKGAGWRWLLTDSRCVLQVDDGTDDPNNGSWSQAGGTTPSPITAYWEMEEASGSDRVDIINGIHLIYTGGGSDTSTQAGTGKIGHGLELCNVAQGSADFDTSAQALLGTQGRGFSVFGWFNMVASGNAGGAFSTGLFVTFYSANGSGSGTVGKANLEIGNIGGGAQPPVQFQINDNVTNSDDNGHGLSPTPGTFYFFHLFFDPSYQGGSLGLSINAGTPVFLTQFDPNFSLGGGAFNGFVLNASAYGELELKGSNPTDVIWDEIGFCPVRALRATEASYLYNSGAGRRPPYTLPTT